MRRVDVNLRERSYPVLIGAGLLSDKGAFESLIPSRQVMVVTNTTVAPLYLERVRGVLAGREVSTTMLPDGEQHKTLAVMNSIISRLLEQRFGRDACLVALGGGVVGDITGFAAACFQRGICYVQAPTTLLSQVDAAVGGKTAVNHELGKNMIGAFHQPAGVIADIGALHTLSRREFTAGLAEVIKYGLIRDAGFFDWLEQNLDALLALEPGPLEYAVERCCAIKAAVVVEDEREGGPRAVLNLGHSFGHAVETAVGYSGWLHGEAVAVGMLMAADLSERMGWIDGSVSARIGTLLGRTGLPAEPPRGLDPAAFRDLMAVDKKSRAGRLRLVLLRGIGEPVVTGDFGEQALQGTLERFLT